MTKRGQQTKLKTTRLAAIRKVMTNYGINYGTVTMIPLHELAFKLNNTRQAELFLSKGKVRIYQCQSRITIKLPGPHVSRLFPAIRHAVKGKESRPTVELRTSPRNKIEYLLLRR